MNQNIPSRHNEKTFRFYEPYIAEAIRQYPNPAIFDISNSGRAMSTFVCRFRDACEGMLKYKWFSKHFARVQVEVIIAEFIVTSLDDKTVFVGRRADLKRKLEVPTPELVVDAKPVYKIEKMLGYEEVALLSKLLQDKVITSTLNIKPGSTAIMDVIAESFDVDLDPQPDGSYNII